MDRDRGLRSRFLRLPVYSWAILIICLLAGVAVGAVLFSATFHAHVNIISLTPNLTILDSDGVTVLSTDAKPNAGTLEFGSFPAGTRVLHRIWIQHNPTGLNPELWINLPGALQASLSDGSQVPDGVVITLEPQFGCFQISSGQMASFDLRLTVSSSVPQGDLSFSLTVYASDGPRGCE